jgi:hypothetical protein
VSGTLRVLAWRDAFAPPGVFTSHLFATGPKRILIYRRGVFGRFNLNLSLATCTIQCLWAQERRRRAYPFRDRKEAPCTVDARIGPRFCGNGDGCGLSRKPR